MASVYNWQLGCDMDYRFDAASPEWQFAAVFNINRCIACQTCTMACKSTWTFSEGQEDMWWNNVETKPYGGYPQHWDVNTLQLLEKANPGGQTWSGSPGEDAPYGTYDGVRSSRRLPRRTPDSKPSVTSRRMLIGPRPTSTRTRRHQRRTSRPVRNCPSTRPGSSTCSVFATIALRPRAFPPAPGTRFTSVPRTASSSSTRSVAGLAEVR